MTSGDLIFFLAGGLIGLGLMLWWLRPGSRANRALRRQYYHACGWHTGECPGDPRCGAYPSGWTSSSGAWPDRDLL